jgi:hypothetical protein
MKAASTVSGKRRSLDFVKIVTGVGFLVTPARMPLWDIDVQSG